MNTKAIRLAPNVWQPSGEPIGALVSYFGAVALRHNHWLYHMNPCVDSRSAIYE